jgi:exopolyphosphatase / guanosine-5'-triphosphate,3'-diphosphate pyrophosphatase
MSRVAAIDCGTNSIRLLVADLTASFDGALSLRDVHREQRIVRLGKGVDATGVLDPEALERTRVALADFTAVLRRKGAERVRMVATSATRDARNREDFFGMVRDTLGAEAEVRAARSVDVGSVRLTERCLPGDPPSPDDVAKAREVAAGILDEAFAAVPVEGVRTWVGVAGTITTLSAVAQGLPEYDPEAVHLSRLPREELHRVADVLLGETREERSRHGGIHPGRIDVIGAGALIVDVLARELHDRAGITELVVSEHDILDGIARSVA